MSSKKNVDITKTLQDAENSRKQKYYRKNVGFFKLLEKIKLWPARSGVLHGIKSIKITSNTAEITTFCGESFLVWNSRNSRASRWLRNKLSFSACGKCKIPDWKIEKYTATMMTQKWGSGL
ncbi:pyrrolysine--tRNA(Pyl) ligase small subunit [Desulfosporosinus sp. BG]|uniref:pyrrolysine--tRNA(Pyl) ligase small subunit n=1 Tax=Desulfosporosinus sp. BG TaxID=1633135 RepID=UPI00083A8C5F|nr:pyrrolysine--tRNA(Pyl) ligase small subunit [Desulfosporosinus sp. BG]ODA39939.1 Pyrrolysyl-tRNA synthetase [Desulfosporosinus sp. BG]